jgi:hypothetical protein
LKAAHAVRLLMMGSVVVLAAGCAHKAPPPLYMWDTFPRMQYDALLGDGVAPLGQLTAMQAQAEKARAAGAALPPGFRAHLGMLKLAAGDPASARQLWQAEKLAFPESAAYMDQLLKRLDSPAKKDNPA